MKKYYLVIYGAAFFFLLAATGAQAHMFWLNVSPDQVKVGQPVKVEIGFGHKFPKDENIKEERLGEVKALTPDGRQLTVKKISTGLYEFAPPVAGVYLVSAQVVPGFVTRTPKGMKMQTKKGVPDANYCFHFDMSAKTLVNAGGVQTGTGATVKTPLEIVPLKNPGAVKPGEALPVEVRFQGQPLAGVEVKFTNDHWTDPQKPFAVLGKTDAKGQIQVKPDKAGKWLLLASHKTPYPTPEECDDNMYAASLAFTVR